MSDVVLAGLISAGASIVIQVIISSTKSRETSAKMMLHEQKQEDSINEVKKELVSVKNRLDKHNGYAEMFHENSKNIAIMSEKQESMSRAINQLQKDIDYLKSDRCHV